MTAAFTDTDILSEVDLGNTPVCQVLSGNLDTPRMTWRPCNRPAAWVAHIPCCKFSLLVCNACHDAPAPWSCRKCGAMIPDGAIGWVRL